VAERRQRDLDLVSDSLEMECDRYLALVSANASPERTAHSLRIIRQLWMERKRSGDTLPRPDVSAAVFRAAGNMAQGWAIRWVGSVKKTLKARRGSNYGR
jgi:hypothetical protein